MGRLFQKKPPRPRTAALLAAGGLSRRMGADKLMAELLGLPVVLRTLLVFEQCRVIDEIVLITREELIPELLAMARAERIQKLRAIVKGGESRQQSVHNGALAVSPETALLCVHDAARPLVTHAVIEAAVEAAQRTGAATAAIPLKDTVKLAQDGLVTATPPREGMVAVQTPQVFARELYLEAYAAAGQEYSDDCQLFEALGRPVALSKGDPCNLKLTTPEDFAVAEALLLWREER